MNQERVTPTPSESEDAEVAASQVQQRIVRLLIRIKKLDSDLPSLFLPL